MSHSKPTVNLDMTQESLEELKLLAKQAGMDLPEFLRNAVRVYSTIRSETKGGKKHVYNGGSRSDVEKEVILP